MLKTQMWFNFSVIFTTVSGIFKELNIQKCGSVKCEFRLPQTPRVPPPSLVPGIIHAPLIHLGYDVHDLLLTSHRSKNLLHGMATACLQSNQVTGFRELCRNASIYKTNSFTFCTTLLNINFNEEL